MLVTKLDLSGKEPITTLQPGAIMGTDIFSKNMDLRDATRLLRRRTQLIVGVTAACAILAFIVALMLTPLYHAEAVVLLEPRKTDVVNISSVMSNLTAGSEVLRSEMDIIGSRAIIDRVMNKLNLMEDKEFNPPPSFISKLNPMKWFEPKVPDEEAAARKRSQVADSIDRRLRINNDGRSYSIHIAFDSKDPKKAALIANTFADEYLVDQLEAKYEATDRANRWLSDRLGQLKQQVEIAEKAVEDFRQKSKLIALDDGQTISSRQMEEVTSQLTEARGATSQAEAKLRAAQAMLNARGGVDSAADVLSSPLIQSLRQQEAEVRRNEAEMTAKYGALHPKMINARAQYKEIQNKIAEEVHKVIQGLANEVDIARAKQNTLSRELQKLESRAGVEMRDSVTLRQLQREADANRTLYEDFLSRFKETTEQKDLQMPDSRIIARADIPASPSFPKKLLFMLVGTILGGILGVVLAYLVEYFDRGFRSSSQVEEATGMPVIGLIPDLRKITKKSPEDYVVEKPLSSFGEALRTVRTAIHFSNVDHPPKIVMITSATPGEGKTTFCLSMARTLAKSGNRILLIDADLRRSRIALATGLKKVNGGLSALLSGEKTFAEVVAPDPAVPGLDILPAAGKTPNAQDLLGSHQMHKIVHEVAKNYDLVIIDTPPILAVSDAAMVARTADTSVFLVQWAEVSQDLVIQSLKQLKGFGCRVAGIAMTQVNLEEHAKYTDSYYHHNYSEYYAN